MKTAKIDITDGRISFGKMRLKNLIRSLDDGSWLFTVEQWTSNMTWRQIKFVKGVLRGVYSEYTGYTVQEAEDRLKKEYGITERITVDGQPCLKIVSFSDDRYTKKRMGEFITDVMHHLEYDCGVVIDPEIRKQYKIDELTGELTEMNI